MDTQKQARLAAFDRYIRRLEARQQALAARDQRFVFARLATIIPGIVAAILILILPENQLVKLAFGVLVAGFAGVVFLHRKVDRSRLNVRLALALALTQRSRMTLDWQGIPISPPIAVDAGHPFANDLDLVGSQSLHQLIDTAISRGGSQRLSSWLLQPLPEAEKIRQRQALLQEMLPLTGFRNRLAKKGIQFRDDVKEHWDGEKLLNWLNQNMPQRSFLPTLALLSCMAAVNIVLYLLNSLGVLPAYWMIGVALYGLIYLYRYGDYKALFEDAYTIGKSLGQLQEILAFLEEYPYPRGGGLEQLCAPFRQADQRPSRYMRRLVWITSAVSLGNNQVYGLIFNAVAPWNLIFAHIMKRYKEALRASLIHWQDTWYELEALNSLANFAYLNPGYVFPQLMVEPPGAAQVIFEACSLGHPLLPDGVKVCNDFSFHKLGEVAIITGSNMSGKSTFLRTLGINLCLAQAGGPVNATNLRAMLFRVFTCIQVSDSLSNGISYFYAEVRRLRALLGAIQADSPYPLFFLVDEIYRGTNNRERQIGSQAYVRALTQFCGVGLVSTHDLELVKLADQGEAVLNYHFREDVQDDRMVFDYRLQPGPCPTTNALKIMRLEGLPVEALPMQREQ